MQVQEPHHSFQGATGHNETTLGSGATLGSGTAPNGLVLVDKPTGPSSFSVVRHIGRGLGGDASTRKVKAGHAGTLDPAASGLLLVLVGPATRLAQYLVGLDKRYRTEIQLGVTTTTGDAEGELLAEGPVRSTQHLAEELVGAIELPVPAASAVKIDGERAYRRLRRGEHVEMPTRRSTIHALEVIARLDDRVTLDLFVSSGTYVRAIAQHLGGHCLSIRRLAAGPFNVSDADPTTVLPPADALAFLQHIEVDAAGAAALRNGRTLPNDGEGTARALHAGQLVAVVRLDGNVAQPATVIAP